MVDEHLPRHHRILLASNKLEEAIQELDNCQAGDWRNEISPLKHELRAALWPFIERIREIARQAYLDAQQK